MKEPLRFRQIHLDFHTSPAIPEIGKSFNKERYQETLKRAAVNSVTTFATCHHGWAYYDTEVGKRHPHLSFDLLRAQFDACKEININVPIYLTAGVNNLAADEHPEWREVGPSGQFTGWAKSNTEAGFKMLSFHSPYLDYLCEQIQEVVRLFPDADGIFLDIINQGEDCSMWALEHMQAKGLDPHKEEDRLQSRYDALMKYYERSTDAARSLDPEMPIFHNSGHVTPGFHKIMSFFSHLELESLPTGGWGYDHFPFSAKYVAKLGKSYLGMTGKFHSTWGEFGGYKHPNALRYECCAMLANGARCSVGDQLHPTGEIDSSTYDIIGEAYREVEQKEAYVLGAESLADVGLLSSQSVEGEKAWRHQAGEKPSDTGASRVLLEEHILFDVIDPEMDFAPYRVLLLPDDVKVNASLEKKLRDYLAKGGKLFLTGNSAYDPDQGMLFDVGGEVGEQSPYQPDFILPNEDLQPDFVHKPMVMYARARRLKAMDGQSLGEVYDPYFNREWNHFCSHQHTPARPEASGYHLGSRNGNILYLAHPVFTIYRSFGQVALRHFIGKCLKQHLNEDRRLELKNFPSTARATLTAQPAEDRYVLHLLNANPISRGGEADLHGGNLAGRMKSYEVIEDIIPLRDIEIKIRLSTKIQKATLEPQGKAISFDTNQDGSYSLTLPELDHHQMIVFKS